MVENISLYTDRTRPANSFFFRQDIHPTTVGQRFTYGIHYADFQSIFFKCNANLLLKMISFILFDCMICLVIFFNHKVRLFSDVGKFLISQTFFTYRPLFCTFPVLKLFYLVTIFKSKSIYINFLRRSL